VKNFPNDFLIDINVGLEYRFVRHNQYVAGAVDEGLATSGSWNLCLFDRTYQTALFLLPSGQPVAVCSTKSIITVAFS
jgi:hypothetical protein